MVVAMAPSWRQTNQQQIKLNVDDLQLSLTLGVTAKQAKHRLSRFLLDEVSLFSGPEEPILVVDGTTAF